MSDQNCIYGDCENGYGGYAWDNGDKYEGEWKDDKMHGKGTIIFANGGEYAGEHIDGKLHGQGTFTTADGKVLKGLFENDDFVRITK